MAEQMDHLAHKGPVQSLQMVQAGANRVGAVPQLDHAALLKSAGRKVGQARIRGTGFGVSGPCLPGPGRRA